MSSVAISETMGSRGEDIGRALARTLGCEFADREIIAKTAERFHESPIDLTHVTEEKPTFWERFTDTQRRYVASVEATLFEMASRDNVVLSGRAAAILLARIPHVLRVRVTAPEAPRAERVEQRLGLTREGALDLVRQTDRERAARIKFLYHVDWDDPLLYDLVLNTERLPVETATRILVETLAGPRYTATPESHRQLTDLSIAAQAKALLLTDPATSTLQVFASCTGGHLAVNGIVDWEAQRKAVHDIVSAIPGVKGVVDEIVVRPPRMGASA